MSENDIKDKLPEKFQRAISRVEAFLDLESLRRDHGSTRSACFSFGEGAVSRAIMKAPYKRTTVASASRHTTPEPSVRSLSHPRSASEVGCPEVKSSNSSSRTMLREGFTDNTGTVCSEYTCPDNLCDSSM